MSLTFTHRRLAHVGVALVLTGVSGCGGGSDKPRPASQPAASQPAASQAQNVQAYQNDVTALIHRLSAVDKPLDTARTDKQAVVAAKKLEPQWMQIAAKLDALNARPSAKKYQDQMVALLRRGAHELDAELSSAHPDASKLGSILGATVPKMGPLISSLYAAP